MSTPSAFDKRFIRSRVSKRYSPTGQLKGETVSYTRDKTGLWMLPIIKEAFNDYKGPSTFPAVRSRVLLPDLLTVYPIVDLHLGMYSWKRQTGQDYDVAIAKKLLSKTMGQLVDLSPASDTAIVLNLGDFFHSDNNENRTRRSGNKLDVDTRYEKVLRAGVYLIIEAVDRALRKHKRVIVRNLRGNHDYYTALSLTIGLEQHFRNCDRVIVDTDPGYYFFHRFGKVLIGATHGDMAQAEEMPGIMATKVPKLWGDSEYRYVYVGHRHSVAKKLLSENSGAVVEQFQTLAPRDAWGSEAGHIAGRSMTAITHDRKSGEFVRYTRNVKGPE